MRFVTKKTGLLVTAGLMILTLTACGGGSNTISSLTDSDSTTSAVTAGAAAVTESSSVPVITPGAVSGTTAAAGTAAAGTAAVGTAGTTASTATQAPSDNIAAASGITASETITPAAGGTGTALSTAPTADVVNSTSEDYSEDGDEDYTDEEEFVPAGEGNTGTTTTDVRFRSEPDADNGDDNVIDELDEGTEVIVLGREGDFFKVQVGDTIGYIHSDYIA